MMMILLMATRNPANSPVEVGSLTSLSLQGLYILGLVKMDGRLSSLVTQKETN